MSLSFHTASSVRPLNAVGTLLLGALLVGTQVASAASLSTARWRWSNPGPHGNNVLDMATSGDTTVQVGDSGQVYVRRGSGRWAPVNTGYTNYLRSAAFLGTRILVVGEGGLILWSDDGKNFAPAAVSPPTANWFEGVAASGNRAVAVGDAGFIYTTADGTNWTKATTSDVNWLRGVTFGGGNFIAVGENGTVLRSSSGSSWNKVTISTTAHLNRVRALTVGSTLTFITVGDGGVAFSSPTGTGSWVTMSSGSTNHLYDAAMNDTGTLLVGDQELRFRPPGGASWTNQVGLTSTNLPPAWIYVSGYGTSNTFSVAGRAGLYLEGTRTNLAASYYWQLQPDSSHAWLWDVTVQNGTYAAVGDLATILTSLDGIVWAKEAVPIPATNNVLLGVGGTTNLLLAVGSAGNILVSYAGLTNLTITNIVGTNLVVTNTTFNTLGLIWTNLPGVTTNTLQGVGATSNLYVLTGDFGTVLTSPDGTNWTLRPTPTNTLLSSVTPYPGGWIAVGQRGTLLRAGANAATWETVPMSTTNWLFRVRWVGNSLVTVGQNGTLFTSPDGFNWTARATGIGARLNDVTFLDGTWYVVGNQGTVLASTNLSAWAPVGAPTGKSVFGAATWNGQMLCVGIEGIILRNQVVPLTTPVNFLGYNFSQVTNIITTPTNTLTSVTNYQLYLFGGEPDQFFNVESGTNVASTTWRTNATLELFDPSGTLYLLTSRNLTNSPPYEFHRTRLVP